MQQIVRTAVLAASLTLLAGAAAKAQGTLPQGVSQQMVDEGTSIFKGRGMCTACHGADAKGMPNLGANLTDEKWLHSDGSFEGIVRTITQGVSADKSSSHAVMPPKGGSSLSDAQLKAVAAYVWSLSHRPK